jgi:aminoglycoside/choline kinase family phosphotransferase
MATKVGDYSLNNRVLEIGAFLEAQGWGEAEQTPIDADFSPRHYARLLHPDGRRAILMDADADQKTTSFVCLAKILLQLNIRAPQIFASNSVRGLVLMEDFGDQNIGQLIDAKNNPRPLYLDAARLLGQLHSHFDPSIAADIHLPHFNSTLFTQQVELYLDAFVPMARGHEVTTAERDSFRQAWLQVLKPLDALPQSLLLRDYMPDNLMLLSDGMGWQHLGVLDFQDAGIGPIAYDLVSLCEVVRRDGGHELLDAVLGVYCAEVKPSITYDELKRAAIILSAQRHMRILGIIAQLAQRGRREKLTAVPRISAHLDRMLAHEVLQQVRALDLVHCQSSDQDSD